MAKRTNNDLQNTPQKAKDRPTRTTLNKRTRQPKGQPKINKQNTI